MFWKMVENETEMFPVILVAFLPSTKISHFVTLIKIDIRQSTLRVRTSLGRDLTRQFLLKGQFAHGFES